MGNNLVFHCKGQHFFDFFCCKSVDIDYPAFCLILHVEKMLPIEVKRNTILVERQSLGCMRHKYILVQVRNTDRSHLAWLILFSSILHIDSKDTVEVTVHESE